MLRTILIILTAICACVMPNLEANEVFDSNYQIKISETTDFGFVSYNGKWKHYQTITLENGLKAEIVLETIDESEAKEICNNIKSGYVNLIPNKGEKTFTLVYENEEYSQPVEIKVNEQKFKKLPRIKGITEDIETVPGVFLSKTKYRYMIELNDGSVWLTKFRSSRWQNQWEIGARIVKLGNSLNQCIVNIDESMGDTRVKSDYILTNLELVTNLGNK